MGKVFRRKNSSKLWCTYVVNGKRYRESTGTDSMELAKAYIRRKEDLIYKEEYDLLKKSDKDNVTFQELVDEYVVSCRANNVKEGSIRRYMQEYNNFSRFLKQKYPRMQKALIDEFKARHLEQYKAFKKKPIWGRYEDSPAKDKTINDELNNIKSLFNYAVKNGYLAQNPFVNVKTIKIRDNKPVIVLGKDEIKEFISTAEEWFAHILLMFCLTGMRRDEVRLLMWQEIDLEHGFIVLKRDLKTERSKRAIPLHPMLVSILEEYYSRAKERKENDYIFVDNKRDNLEYQPNRFRNELIKLSEQLRKPEFTCVHWLRHTFTSLMIESGAPVKFVQDILGHTTSLITDRYTHLSLESKAGWIKGIME